MTDNHNFLLKSQICLNTENTKLPKIKLVDLMNKDEIESGNMLSAYQDFIEDENILIVDNYKLDTLDYFTSLIDVNEDISLADIHNQLPYTLNDLLDPNSKAYKKKIFTSHEDLDTFEENAKRLLDQLSSLFKKSFSFKIDNIIEKWRFYPVMVGALHIDLFHTPPDIQTFRIFINIDHRPRFLSISKAIWDLPEFENSKSWPHSYAECLQYTQDNFITDKVDRYKLDVHTVLLKPGSIWIANPAHILHCGIIGFKGLGIDFEVFCDSLNDPAKSSKERWENFLGKPLIEDL